MAKQWISAADARKLISSTRTICERLNAGLITAKAARFLSDRGSDADVIVPRRFWWAEGRAGLNQNWETGDFSTSIDEKTHLRAFGVRFEIEGVLAMLPAEQRALAAQRLSVAGNNEWICSRAALRLIQKRTGVAYAGAVSSLSHQLSFGFVAARAVLAELAKTKVKGGELEWRHREWDVPLSLWKEIINNPFLEANFELGNFEVAHCPSIGGKFLCLRDMHFFGEDLERLWPDQAAPSDNITAKSPGGRPPAAFSDDLMCAIWAKIYEGDLKPKKQSDIEAAMLAWASTNGHALGESTAREKAKKVWKYVKPEATNPKN